MNRITDQGLLQAGGIPDQASADLQAADEKTRSNLISMAQPDIDTGTAAQMPNSPIVPGSYSFNKGMDAAAYTFDTEMGPYAGEAIPLGMALPDVLTGRKIRAVDPDKGLEYKRADIQREEREIKANISSERRACSIIWSYNKIMQIEFDEAKRAITLAERGLDFADAGAVFAGPAATRVDVRHDYGEPRYQTLGWLNGRAVVVVWTPRGAARRIISMRHSHDSEAKAFGLD